MTALQLHRAPADALTKLGNGDVRLPLSILVAGSSEAVMVVPPRTRRTDGTYGEQLVPLLDGAGVPATVENAGQWFATISDLRRRYEHALRNRFPDVVVLRFGFIESQPNAVPTWLARNLQSWDRSSHPAAVWYHEQVAARLWKRLREVQRTASERDWPTYRLAPARFEAELRHVVGMIREETGALVLVQDLDPFGERLMHWLPGMERRRAQYQAVLRRVTDSFDDDVRLVASPLPDPGPLLEALKPDGIHLNAQGHRLAAQALCREILDWLDRP